MGDPSSSTRWRIGIDENGLGARLGPLAVTGVLAVVDDRGERMLRRKLPARLRPDLDDSKRLVSCHDYSLGEAWARALCGSDPASPADLFAALSLEGQEKLEAPCPTAHRAQCWNTTNEAFVADAELVTRVRSHVRYLAERGVELRMARTSVVCVKLLNEKKERGINRFMADLHAMERLVLHFREHTDADITAVCGKVGGIGEYSRFFGPLGGSLHVTLEEGRAKSAYRFPGLGELAFVRDADASDPLVMIASLVGKYVRELLMGRIARHWRPAPAEDEAAPSGYHDPVTDSFVARTEKERAKKKLPTVCFERTPADGVPQKGSPRAKASAPSKPSRQASLFSGVTEDG